MVLSLPPEWVKIARRKPRKQKRKEAENTVNEQKKAKYDTAKDRRLYSYKYRARYILCLWQYSGNPDS